MIKFKEIELGVEGLNFIRDRLGEGKSLSHFLLQSRNFEGGRVTTYLPEEISDERARQFSTGGKLPIPKGPAKNLVTDDGTRWRMERKPSADGQLVRTIRDFLTEKRSCCLLEDVKSRPTDPRIRPEDGRIKVMGDEVYYLLDEKDSMDEEKIARTVRDAHSDWHFVCVMSLVEKEGGHSEPSRSVTRDELIALANRAIKIVIGAYDGEGYLTWSRSRG